MVTPFLFMDFEDVKNNTLRDRKASIETTPIKELIIVSRGMLQAYNCRTQITSRLRTTISGLHSVIVCGIQTRDTSSVGIVTTRPSVQSLYPSLVIFYNIHAAFPLLLHAFILP